MICVSTAGRDTGALSYRTISGTKRSLACSLVIKLGFSLLSYETTICEFAATAHIKVAAVAAMMGSIVRLNRDVCIISPPESQRIGLPCYQCSTGRAELTKP